MPHILETLFRYIVLGGIFLVPATVLVVSPGLSFPFITGKAFAFRILVEIIFAAWLALALYRPGWRPRFSLAALAVGVFVLVIGIADALGVNPHRSFWSNFERMDGFVSLLHLAAFFIVLTSALSTERLWYRFFGVSLAVSALVALYGFAQAAGVAPLFQSQTRIESVFGNSGFLAAYALIHTFLAAFFLARPAGVGNGRFLIPNISAAFYYQWFYGAALALNFSILALSGTRGALVGAFGGALLASLLVLLFEKRARRARVVAASIIAVLALAGSSLWFFANTPLAERVPALSRVSVSSLLEDAQPRLAIWKIALAGVAERPLLGWGQENFSRVFDAHYDPALYSEEPWFDRAHNAPLDWLVAAGVFGLAAYLALFFAALFALWRRHSPVVGGEDEPAPRAPGAFSTVEKSIMTGLFAGYFLQNLFIFDTLGSALLFFALLAYLARSGEGAMRREGVGKDGHGSARAAFALSKPRALYPAIAALALSLAGVLWTVNIEPARAAAALVRATTPQDTPQKNLDAFDDALAHATFGQEAIIIDLLSVSQAAAESPSLSDEEKAAFLETALDRADAEIHNFSDSTRFYIRLGDTLAAHGYYEEALIPYGRAIELSPEKQRTYFQAGVALLAMGKREEAKQLFAHAFERAPGFTEARILYAVSLIYIGNFDAAQTLFAEIEPKKWINDGRILNAYTAMKRYKEVVAIWEARLADEPEDFDTRLGLGVAYALAGETARGIAAIKEAIALDPSRENEGMRYIDGIRAGLLKP